jgi:RIO kinase 1
MAYTIEVGQFDDAPDSNAPTQMDPRAGHPYIDTSSYDSDDLPLPPDSDYDDEIDEEYDENRAEDEDWEVAEGGVILLS